MLANGRVKTASVLGVVGALAIGLSAPAMADTLNLSSSPGSTDTWVPGPPAGITFTGLGSVDSGNSGVFAELVPCTNCVTPTSFTATTGPLTVFTINDGADTATINLSSYTFTPAAGNATLTIMAVGTATLTGEGTVPIDFTLTVPSPPAPETESWDVNINTTPLPGALPLFASGLLGVWGFTRRRKTTAQLGA